MATVTVPWWNRRVRYAGRSARVNLNRQWDSLEKLFGDGRRQRDAEHETPSQQQRDAEDETPSDR